MYCGGPKPEQHSWMGHSLSLCFLAPPLLANHKTRYSLAGPNNQSSERDKPRPPSPWRLSPIKTSPPPRNKRIRNNRKREATGQRGGDAQPRMRRRGVSGDTDLVDHALIKKLPEPLRCHTQQ